MAPNLYTTLAIMPPYLRRSITGPLRNFLPSLERLPESFGEGQAVVLFPPVHENHGRQGGGGPGKYPIRFPRQRKVQHETRLLSLSSTLCCTQTVRQYRRLRR